MFKFLFALLTDPLSLPINPIWEYIILTIIGVVAFKIAWNESPGGLFGSLIHWTIRFFVFVLLWIITDTIIVVCQWLIENWVVAALGVFVLMITGIALKAFKRHERKKKVMDDDENDSEPGEELTGEDLMDTTGTRCQR